MHRRHHPRAQDARRRQEGRPQEGKPQGARSRHGQPRSATSRTCKKFGLPAVVSINRFSADTDAEIALVKEKCKALGVEALMADHWAMGGEGAADVAQGGGQDHRRGQGASSSCSIPTTCRCSRRSAPSPRKSTAPTDVDRRQVGDATSSRRWEEMGFGKLPVCIAKTQYSFSTNPDCQGRADRPHRSRARSAALRRRRVRRGDLRRDHDHAGPAARCRRPTRSTSAPDGRIVGLF